MSNFFRSEVVQKELQDMGELYMEINRMGLVLSIDQKREQLHKMMRLIEIQQTMYMRCLLYTSPSPRD